MYKLWCFTILMCAFLALPAWAGEMAGDDVLELTVTAYQNGEIYAGGAPHLSATDGLTESFGVGNDDGNFEYWMVGIYQPQATPPDWLERELARFNGNVQHVSFHGAEFMFYSSAVDWIEIDVRVCSRADWEQHQSVLSFSEEIKEGIMNQIFKPAGRIAFAATKFHPVPWPVPNVPESEQ